MAKSNTETRASDTHSGDQLASTRLPVKMNLFPMSVQLDTVFLYEITTTPAIVNNETLKKVVETFLADQHLSPFLFQQNRLMLATRFELREGNVAVAGTTYTIRLCFSEQKAFRTDEQTQNEAMNAVFEKMGMDQIGRNHFWPHQTVSLEQNEDLEIRQGITSAIHIGKGVPIPASNAKSQPNSPKKLSQSPEKSSTTQKPFLEVDLVSKVAHTQPLSQEIQKLLTEGKTHEEIDALLNGRTFFTKHNKKVYQIEAIAWDIHPTSTFLCTSMPTQPNPALANTPNLTTNAVQTREISYAQYFQEKYNVRLVEMNQSFILCSVRQGMRRGNQTGTNNQIYIPTELAVLINLSDTEREDFSLMQEITQATQFSPLDRQHKLTDFVRDARLNRELGKWNVQVSPSMVSTEAKKFEPVKIQVADRILTGPNWQYPLNNNHILEPIPLFNWVLAYDKTRIRPEEINRLIDNMQSYGAAIGMDISRPRIYPVDNLENFLKAYKCMERNQLVQIILTVGTGRSKRLYRAIKKRCYEELGIPSQHMRINAIKKHPDSVIKNILRQMNVKAFADPGNQDFSSGTLWSIDQSCIPDNTMIIGIDVWHGFSGQNESIAGVVSSFDGGLHFSADPLPLHRISQEILPNLFEVIKKRLIEYHAENEAYPDNLLIFRDGVGNSQMIQVLQQEIGKILEHLQLSKAQMPHIAFICANKRIHRRIFVPGASDTVNNAPVGTVVDGIGNAEDFPNFYLVSHSTNQGTITPTHYSIIYNDTTLTTEQLSAIAYQLAHLYFNWPGGIRTPGPIQYAHKLAFQMGQNNITTIHPQLEKTYYFL